MRGRILIIFHEDARAHEKSHWHQENIANAKNFSDSVDMKTRNKFENLDSAKDEAIQSNRTKLRSNLKIVIYCGTDDFSIRGKLSQSGNFQRSA